MQITKSLANQFVNIKTVSQFIQTVRNIAIEYENQHPVAQSCFGRFLSIHHNHSRAEKIIAQANALLAEGKEPSDDEVIDFIQQVKTQSGNGSLCSLMQLAVINLFKRDTHLHAAYLEAYAPDVTLSNEGEQDIPPAFYQLIRAGWM